MSDRIKKFYEMLDTEKKISNIVKNKKHIIITGLHRSCTSILFKTIGKSEIVSKHSNTNLPEDESVWLQNIYPKTDEISGLTDFCFVNKYRLDENSDFILYKNRILHQWSHFWDLGKDILVQKSPSHIIHSKFINELLPDSYWILINRHPIYYYYSLKSWDNNYQLERSLDHWLEAHRIFYEDTTNFKNILVIKSEDLIVSPDVEFKKINKLLGIDLGIHDFSNINKNINIKYKNKWDSFKNKDYIINKYESKINKYDYSFHKM